MHRKKTCKQFGWKMAKVNFLGKIGRNGLGGPIRLVTLNALAMMHAVLK